MLSSHRLYGTIRHARYGVDDYRELVETCRRHGHTVRITRGMYDRRLPVRPCLLSPGPREWFGPPLRTVNMVTISATTTGAHCFGGLETYPIKTAGHSNVFPFHGHIFISMAQQFNRRFRESLRKIMYLFLTVARVKWVGS